MNDALSTTGSRQRLSEDLTDADVPCNCVERRTKHYYTDLSATYIENTDFHFRFSSDVQTKAPSVEFVRNEVAKHFFRMAHNLVTRDCSNQYVLSSRESILLVIVIIIG